MCNATQGEGLESAIACPAWAPILSLESVDGELWRGLRTDFDALMRQLPPAAALQVRRGGRGASLSLPALPMPARCSGALSPRQRSLGAELALSSPCCRRAQVLPLVSWLHACMQAAAERRLDELVASGRDIDADAIVRWSLGTFIEYLFGIREWRPEFEALVAASW